MDLRHTPGITINFLCWHLLIFFCMYFSSSLINTGMAILFFGCSSSSSSSLLSTLKIVTRLNTENSEKRGWGLSEELTFVSENLCHWQSFNLIRLDFSSMSPRFLFFCCFVATQPSIRNAHKWFKGKPGPGSTRLEDTPAMDLEPKGIRTHM